MDRCCSSDGCMACFGPPSSSISKSMGKLNAGSRALSRSNATVSPSRTSVPVGEAHGEEQILENGVWKSEEMTDCNSVLTSAHVVAQS